MLSAPLRRSHLPNLEDIPEVERFMEAMDALQRAVSAQGTTRLRVPIGGTNIVFGRGGITLECGGDCGA
jgi:hypothetical protein